MLVIKMMMVLLFHKFEAKRVPLLAKEYLPAMAFPVLTVIVTK